MRNACGLVPPSKSRDNGPSRSATSRPAGPAGAFRVADLLRRVFVLLSALADNDRADHVRVQGVEIRIGTGFVEPETEAIAGVERFRLKDRIDNRVRLLIVIDSCHFRPRCDRQAP